MTRWPFDEEGHMQRGIQMVLASLMAAALVAVGPAARKAARAAGERDVTIAQGIDAEFLDVQMTNNIVTLIINGSIYDTLLTRDKQLQLVPALATSYKLVGDKVWEVKLRQGVKFHNGETFDATAVKFSFERINRADFKSPQKGWFSTIEAVEIVDPFTVRFHTKVPDPSMPARMTLMYQLPPKNVAQVGDAQANLKPVGRGPSSSWSGRRTTASWSRRTTPTGAASPRCGGRPGSPSPSWGRESPPSRRARPISSSTCPRIRSRPSRRARTSASRRRRAAASSRSPSPPSRAGP